MNDTQYKICHDAQVKLSGPDDGPGEITFYLSTFSNWDRVRPIPERPAKGAFAPFLDEFIKDGWLGESHMWENRPVGTIKDAGEDALGLIVTAEFHGTPEGQQARQTARERMARGKGVKTSMGYTVRADEYVPIEDEALKAEGLTEGRILLKVPVFEASLVNRPANPMAVAVGVKGEPGAGFTFQDRADALVAGAAELLKSAQRQQEARVKEGRVFSTANRAKLTDTRSALADLMALIDELLSASEPKAAPAAVLQAMHEYRMLMSKFQEIT
jgi:hypothetical protein